MSDGTWPMTDLPGVLPASGPYWLRKKATLGNPASEPLIALFTRYQDHEAGWWRPLNWEHALGDHLYVGQEYDFLGPVPPCQPAHRPDVRFVLEQIEESGESDVVPSKPLEISERIAELEMSLALSADLLRQSLALLPDNEGTKTIAKRLQEIRETLGSKASPASPVTAGMVRELRETMECSLQDAHKALVLTSGNMEMATNLLRNRHRGGGWLSVSGMTPPFVGADQSANAPKIAKP